MYKIIQTHITTGYFKNNMHIQILHEAKDNLFEEI